MQKEQKPFDEVSALLDLLKNKGVQIYTKEQIEEAGYAVETTKTGKLKAIKSTKETTAKEQKPKATKAKTNEVAKVVETIKTNLMEWGINANISQNGNIRSLTLEKKTN